MNLGTKSTKLTKIFVFYTSLYIILSMKILKNKWTWIGIIGVFLAYQIIPELLTYERNPEYLNTISEKNIKAASETGGKSQ